MSWIGKPPACSTVLVTNSGIGFSQGNRKKHVFIFRIILNCAHLSCPTGWLANKVSGHVPVAVTCIAYQIPGQAVERCFVSQPTLSGQIKKHEEELGVILFERTKRSVQTTNLVESIVECAKRVLEQVDGLRQLAHSNQDPLLGPLRMGAIPTLSPYLMPLILKPLKRRYPHGRLARCQSRDAAADGSGGIWQHFVACAGFEGSVSSGQREHCMTTDAAGSLSPGIVGIPPQFSPSSGA